MVRSVFGAFIRIRMHIPLKPMEKWKGILCQNDARAVLGLWIDIESDMEGVGLCSSIANLSMDIYDGSGSSFPYTNLVLWWQGFSVFDRTNFDLMFVFLYKRVIPAM